MSQADSAAPILCTIDARGVATVVLNRPEVNNAYNGALLDGMLATERAALTRPSCRSP